MGSESKDLVVSPMYSTGVGLVLKGFEYIEQYPEQFESLDVDKTIDDNEESTNEISLVERITGWFVDEDVD